MTCKKAKGKKPHGNNSCQGEVIENYFFRCRGKLKPSGFKNHNILLPSTIVSILEQNVLPSAEVEFSKTTYQRDLSTDNDFQKNMRH